MPRRDLAGRLHRIRDGIAVARRDLVTSRRLAREPVAILYVRCDGCGDVTSHLSTQHIHTITRTDMVTTPPEIVCDLCEHAQPRTRDDEVVSDTQLVCTAFRYRRWRGGRSRRRRCGRTFVTPAIAARPRCQWCLSLQPIQS